MVREIDGNEKVSEWMERNKVSGGGCCDPISPLPELDHRVIQPDLLVQVKLNQLVLSYIISQCNVVNRGSEQKESENRDVLDAFYLVQIYGSSKVAAI